METKEKEGEASGEKEGGVYSSMILDDRANITGAEHWGTWVKARAVEVMKKRKKEKEKGKEKEKDQKRQKGRRKRRDGTEGKGVEGREKEGEKRDGREALKRA